MSKMTYHSDLDTNLARIVLNSALDEFKPQFIISRSSKSLDADKYDLVECPYVEDNEYYLIPYDSEFAEFVVWKPVGEDTNLRAFIMNEDEGRIMWYHVMNEELIRDSTTYL